MGRSASLQGRFYTSAKKHLAVIKIYPELSTQEIPA